jgi:endoglucanase
MTRAGRRSTAVGLAAAGIAAVVVAALSASSPPASSVGSHGAVAAGAVEHFLRTYVDGNGRVVRHDQGGDTVSEGQAYAMLLATAIGDRDTFRRVWRWTDLELRRDDGLLSYLWRDGRVADAQAAADADLDAAWALLLAADRFRVPAYRRAGVALGRAILAGEVAHVVRGPVLVAGPWAMASPHTINPSYFSPGAYVALGAATGDPAWAGLARTSRSIVDVLTRDPARLPPDWARLDANGSSEPTGSPGADGDPPGYAFDATRTLLRLGTDCSAAGPRLAARAWPLLQRQVRDGFSARSALDGTPRGGGEHPSVIVGAAAAAQAAGAESEAALLLDRAEAVEARHSTYYGAALVALGRVALQTEWLGRC